MVSRTSKPNNFLRQQRMRRGWTLDRLADELYKICRNEPRVGARGDINAQMISRWETGKHPPSLYYQEKLCILFGKSADELGFIEMQIEQKAVERQELAESISTGTFPPFINTSPSTVNDVSLLRTQQSSFIQEPSKCLMLPSSMIQMENSELESQDWAIWFGLKVAQILRAIGLWSGHAILCDDVQTILEQEIKTMDEMLRQYQIHLESSIPRRQALVTIAALPMTLLAILKQSGSTTDLVSDEFLPQCAASITACWHLLKGKGLKAVGEILPQFAPFLTTLALRPLKHQQIAARLATQTSVLQAILAMHRLDPIAREKHCNDAVRYSCISEDSKLQAAALMYLGYTFSFCYSRRKPEKAIPVFLQGLNLLGDEASLLKSDILMGLAEAYAQCKDEQQALRYISLAQTHFPAYPEHDPSYIYADCDLNVLYQWEGKTYLELAEHYSDRGYQQKAGSALMQSIGVQSISERSMNETVVYQADAARILGELDVFVDCLRDAAQMAVELGSRKRFNQAFMVYQRTPEKWFNEPQIQSLAKDVFRQLPTGRTS